MNHSADGLANETPDRNRHTGQDNQGWYQRQQISSDHQVVVPRDAKHQARGPAAQAVAPERGIHPVGKAGKAAEQRMNQSPAKTGEVRQRVVAVVLPAQKP